MCVQRQYRKSHTPAHTHTPTHTRPRGGDNHWQPLKLPALFRLTILCVCVKCSAIAVEIATRKLPPTETVTVPQKPILGTSSFTRIQVRICTTVYSRSEPDWRTFLRWNVNFPPTTFQQFVNRSWPSAPSFGLPIANNDSDWKIPEFKGKRRQISPLFQRSSWRNKLAAVFEIKENLRRHKTLFKYTAKALF